MGPYTARFDRVFYSTVCHRPHLVLLIMRPRVLWLVAGLDRALLLSRFTLRPVTKLYTLSFSHTCTSILRSICIHPSTVLCCRPSFGSISVFSHRSPIFGAVLFGSLLLGGATRDLAGNARGRRCHGAPVRGGEGARRGRRLLAQLLASLGPPGGRGGFPFPIAMKKGRYFLGVFSCHRVAFSTHLLCCCEPSFRMFFFLRAMDDIRKVRAASARTACKRRIFQELFRNFPRGRSVADAAGVRERGLAQIDVVVREITDNRTAREQV